MSTEREFDIWMLEIQAANDEMEMEWQLDKLGSRAKRMMANADHNGNIGPDMETAPPPAS